jgi:hypothetical protein
VRDPLVKIDIFPHCCEFLMPRHGAHGMRMAWIAMFVLIGLGSATPGLADKGSKDRAEMQSLDEQVQEIKSDVMSIAAELSLLEEKLIYPSNTQVALFVSLPEGDAVRLDSVQIQIDGNPAGHHVYSFRELEALKKGGVQRLYTGNIKTGEHRLDVSMAGTLRDGGEFEESKSFTVNKGIGPKLLGLSLATKVTGGASIELGNW